MTFEQNLTLGLVMAGIALFSSVFSVLVTGIVNHVLTNRRRKAEKQERLLFLLGEMDSITAKFESSAAVVADGIIGADVSLPQKAAYKFAVSMVRAAKKQMEDASEADDDYLIGFLVSYNTEMKILTNTYFNQILNVPRHEGDDFPETDAAED